VGKIKAAQEDAREKLRELFGETRHYSKKKSFVGCRERTALRTK